jgi:Pvc16 N-terminal domain
MFTHILAASLTLRNALEYSHRAGPQLAQLFAPSPGGKAIVSLATPDGMEAAGDPGLSMWPYRLIRDEHTLNRPPRRIPPDLIRRRPLPLRAHYMMTPIIAFGTNMPAPETERLILGRVFEAFRRAADFRPRFHRRVWFQAHAWQGGQTLVGSSSPANASRLCRMHQSAR